MDLFDSETVAIVTGANSGIGQGVAVRLVQKGVTKMCLTGFFLEGLLETKSKCLEAGQSIEENILLIEGDLTKDIFCEVVVSKTVETFGRIDILVNNVGIVIFKSVEDISMEEFDRLMSTNLRSIFYLSKLCLPYLRKTKGNIVSTSSDKSTCPLENDAPYCMSKAALDMFTMCLALEEAKNGVRVNCVNPGGIDTGIFNKLGITAEQAEAFKRKGIEANPKGRLGHVEEAANMIVFMASKEASFVTGNRTHVSGGAHLVHSS